jgi:Ribosomal protein S3, C-terminal domain.
MNARRLLHSMIKEVMNNGALGAEIVATGKLAAKGARSKQMKIRLGYLPKAGNVTKLVDEAKVACTPSTAR